MKCGGMHPSAMCNKFKQTNSIKTSYKTSPFNKYSPYVRTPLLNNPGRGLNRYDIWQLGYSPINLSKLYIALEKYPRKDIVKLLKDGLTSGFKINYTGLRLQLDTKKYFPVYSIMWRHMKGLNMTFLLAEQQDLLGSV